MLGERITKILVHPLFLGFLITAVLAGIWMPDISRYRVEIQERVYTGAAKKLCYADLDRDGMSEAIDTDHQEHMMKIMLLRNGGVISQYNLRSARLGGDYLFTVDHNGDGHLEVVVLTLRNDSIYLSMIDHRIRSRFLIHERLIYANDTVDYDVDKPQVAFGGMLVMPDGESRFMVFAINSGYGLQPRHVFRYDPGTDRLWTSPLSGAALVDIRLVDLDGDSVPEIIPETAATANFHTYIPFSDHSAWLMVLDSRMQYRIRPVEFAGHPSGLIADGFYEGDSARIIAVWNYFGTEDRTSGLFMYDNEGSPVRSLDLDNIGRSRYSLVVPEDRRGCFWLVDSENLVARCMDASLTVSGEKKIPEIRNSTAYFRVDLDRDGEEDYMFMGKELGSVVLIRSGFRDPVVVRFHEESYPNRIYEVAGGERPLYYLQFPEDGYYLSYGRNPAFLMRFPILLGGYITVSLLIYLVFRLQRYRAQRVFQTQKKIGELQLLSLKNQIDPHFTFNILNSIGSLYTKTDNRKEAYGLFVKYSRLLRSAIQQSDRISTTVGEELEFVRDYIELEQFRCGNSFTSEIHVTGDADPERPIPRMMVHSLVENAIKHGLDHQQGGGRLDVAVSKSGQALRISVKDNGPGIRQKTGTGTAGTGKGLKIIREMIGLFNDLHGTKITLTLHDLSDEKGEDRGTEARILIPISG